MLWGLWRAYPPTHIRHEWRQPHFAVSVVVGDLFDQDASLVVGFTDTFDTAVDNQVISATSVQGQLVRRHYGGDHRRLDSLLDETLAATSAVAAEDRRDKRAGKLVRYPLGTVAVLRGPRHHLFALAYSRMGNDLVARSSVSELSTSLDHLWDAIDRHTQRQRVAMPVIGSGLARIDTLNRENLLAMILLSFTARSRQSIVCHELIVVVPPADLPEVDFGRMAAFLKAL